MAFEYKVPIIGQKRAGTEADPYIPITNDIKKVVDGYCKLNEIPDEHEHVTITAVASPYQAEVYTETFDQVNPIGQYNYRVDYTNGVVYFNTSQNGRTVTFSYKGRGCTYINAARVFTKETNGEVTQTLDDILSLEGLPELIEDAIDAKDALDTSIANGQIGTLSNLTTTDKTSLVGAINEVDNEITLLSGNSGTVEKVNKSDFESHLAEYANLKGYVGYTDNDIYGIEVDIPNNTITRLAGAVGKTAGANFNSIRAFGGRRRCNLADDRTVLAYYGDANYKEDGSNGQVMVEQPKFYYKRVPLVLEPIQDGIGFHLRKWRDYISDYPKAGFKIHPNFVRGGVEYDKIYYPAYESSIYDVSESVYLLNDEQIADFNVDKLSSIAGAKPASGLTQNLTIVNTRKLANNRGEGWQQIDFLAHCAEVLLMSIEYATFDSQTAIGRGVVDKADDGATNMSETTGATSFLGNTSGMAPGTNGQVSVSYRGRENGWGNIWKWNDGLNIECKGIHEAYWADSGFVSDIKTDPYQPCGFTLAKTDGYISAIGYHQDCDFMFLPSETLGAYTRPLNDYFYQNHAYGGFLVAPLGGYWDDGSYAGACFLFANGSSGYRYRSIGGGLLCVPA